MNIEIFFAALAATLNLGLIIFVSIRNRFHSVYKTFILISFCLLLWNLRVIISNLLGPHHSGTVYFSIINKIFFPAVTMGLYLLPVAALHFTVSFLEIKSKSVKNLVRLCYILVVLLSLIYVFNILSPRLLGYLLWLFILPLFCLSLFLIGRAFFYSTSPLERARLCLLLTGGIVGVVGAIVKDILRTLGISEYGVGYAANAFYSSCVAISLFRYRLFYVNLKLRRLAGFLLTLILFTAVSLFLSRIFKLTYVAPYGYILIAVLVILLFGNRVMLYIENILFSKLMIPDQTLTEINSILEKATNVNDLFKLSADILKKYFEISDASFFSYDKTLQKYQLVWSVQPTDSMTPLLNLTFLHRWFSDKNTAEPFIYDEGKHMLKFGNPEETSTAYLAETLTEIKSLGYATCFPMWLEGKLKGLVFMGFKDNNQVFTDTDVRSLKLFAHTCALWLQRFKMLEEIRHLEQLAILGETAAYIAHEIKNPLAIIRSSTQLMKSEDRNGKCTNFILSECDRLDRVVNQLLDFAKTSNTSPSKVTIKKEITEYVEEFSSSQDFGNIDVSVTCKGEIPHVKFDLGHLKQIMVNLMLNAAEAMNGKGNINILISTNSKEYVRVRIRDNGPGIKYEDQRRIFAPFYSTKSGGSGLGLPITRKLLELNNSNIEIISEPTKGCEIIIDMPIWED